MTWTSTGTSFWEATATLRGPSPAAPPLLPPFPPEPPPPGAPEVEAPPFEQPYKNRSGTPITHRFQRTCRNLVCLVRAWDECIDINRSCTLEKAVNHILMLPRSVRNGPYGAHFLELLRRPGGTPKHALSNHFFFAGGGVWVLSSTTSPYLMVERPSY